VVKSRYSDTEQQTVSVLGTTSFTYCSEHLVISAERRWNLLEGGRPEDQEGDDILEVCPYQVYYAAEKCLECVVDQWTDFNISGAFISHVGNQFI